MKVLMLNGSFNPDGSTSAGLEIMAKTFAEEGVGTEIATVGSKPIADCIACGKRAGLKRCVFANDAVNDFAEKAKTADGFVFGSPACYAHPSRRIQSFLDRHFSRHHVAVRVSASGVRGNAALATIVFQKSTNPERIKSNLEVFDFSLAEDEMSAIRALDKGKGMHDPDKPGVAEWLLANYKIHD